MMTIRAFKKEPGMIDDVNDLVAKLHEMREHGNLHGRTTQMMHLFGCIFDNDISAAGTNPSEIERRYRKRYDDVQVKAGISDGRNLKEVMTVDPGVERLWRRTDQARASEGSG
ncbi:MAG: hypothetical protein OXG35_27495 [Acidobacteria bacterium]|nr:hypothetical protein [Acidobacteriota bacterium]